MSPSRTELEEALCLYMTHTLININTVREFCEGFSEWKNCRDEEIKGMKGIKDKIDKELKFYKVMKSEDKGNGFWKYLKNNWNQVCGDRRVKREQDLDGVLNETLKGLETLTFFLDALEKLAVTSMHIFMENQVLRVPEDFRHVQVVITAAIEICPHLLVFKRDAKVFFTPKPQNVEVLIYQLDKYVQTTKEICKKLEKRCSMDFDLKLTNKPVIDMNVDLCEDEIQRMLHHINHLKEIREDQNFRTVFLFQDVSCSDFIREFNERQPRMLQFLKELEETAVQLNKMKKGSTISSVAGSSVGAVAGVLSVIGMALPVTAGFLVKWGAVLGITSRITSAIVTAIEAFVNYFQQNKVNEASQSFMEDVKCLQDCLEDMIKQPMPILEASKLDEALAAGKIVCTVGGIGKAVDSFFDAASDCEAGSGHRNVWIIVNALFVGMDIYFICKDSVSLAKGIESEVSKFIRARAALWSSEMDSWRKIHGCLDEGQETSGEKRAVLKKPFYQEV